MKNNKISSGTRIGIFDSGLGGLIIAKAIRKQMPEYDYVYYGDTKRVPYGNKSHEAVYEFTKEAIIHLIKKENCSLIIVACNTASARALRRIQQEFIPDNFPKIKVLGVLIPTAEIATKYNRIGVVATLGTVNSKTFPIEIKKLNAKVKVLQNEAPMLVPLIEEGEKTLANTFIQQYTKPLINKKIDALILGCTHYPILYKEIRNILPKNIEIISQDKIIPAKLEDYLKRHTEIEKNLSKNKTIKIIVTDETQNLKKLVKKWFGKTNINILS